MNAVGQTLLLAVAALAGFIWWLLEKRSPALLNKGKGTQFIVDPMKFLAAGAFGWAFANSFIGDLLQEWIILPFVGLLGDIMFGISGELILRVVVGALVLIVIFTLLDLKVDKLTLNALAVIPLFLLSAGGALALLAQRGTSAFGAVGVRVTTYLIGG